MLTIVNSSLEDTGNYTCSLLNMATATIPLVVMPLATPEGTPGQSLPGIVAHIENMGSLE